MAVYSTVTKHVFCSSICCLRERLISIVPLKFICKCRLKPTSESRWYLYSKCNINTPTIRLINLFNLYVIQGTR